MANDDDRVYLPIARQVGELINWDYLTVRRRLMFRRLGPPIITKLAKHDWQVSTDPAAVARIDALARLMESWGPPRMTLEVPRFKGYSSLACGLDMEQWPNRTEGITIYKGTGRYPHAPGCLCSICEHLINTRFMEEASEFTRDDWDKLEKRLKP